jgi:elongation factor G
VPSLSTPSIRNVALVGHHGAGKTTLAEALLLCAGAITRPGSVDKGNTVCDFEPEEVSRNLSVSMALAPITIGDTKVNVVDAPGYADFQADMELALSVADLAVIVVSATDGVQGQTEDAWRAAAQRGLPRVLVVNKLDRERADFNGTLAQIRDAFGAGIAPVELPIGREHDLRGVVDLLDGSATLYDTSAGPPLEGSVAEVPSDLSDEVDRVHEQLVEGIVVSEDDLMARYLEGEEIDRAELQSALAAGVESGAVFPVLCCSSTTGVGVDRLARLLTELAPAPGHRGPLRVLAGEGTSDVACDPDGPPLLFVCKTLSDAHAGKISICRVFSGTIKPDVVLYNPRTREEERLHVLEHIRGHATTPVNEVVAGDFVAVPRLGAQTGDTLAPKGTPVRVPLPEMPPPALPVAVNPASRADDDKLMSALHRLQEEDPSLVVRRVDETHQTVLDVAGEIHLAVVLERLARKFGVNVERQDVRVPYRETISRPAEAEGRHKKQTGGHGQFGVVHLKLEPLGRGEGFEFHDAVVGGAIPRQYIPAVEKGVLETMEQGGTHGYPVVDVAATCDDGKHHSVDSSEMAFKLAAGLAFKEALAQAVPVLLEPISRVEVTVPTEVQGDVMGDLHARRARIQGTDSSDDGRQTVVALVPTAELTRYAVDLRALTGGRGRFQATHDHYDTVPEHLAGHIPNGHA